jgi:hypothetical protein
MGKLVKLIVLVAVVAIAAYALVTLTGRSDDDERAASSPRDQRPRLEEKYGFTSETVGD